MIEYRKGDLLAEDAEALVNAVNCVGAMDAGIARQFKKTFPANFEAYAAACERGEVQLGRMFVFDTGCETSGPGSPRFVINFPTLHHWRDKSRMEDIESGLQALIRVISERAVRSIAIPPLGCGYGGLDWPRVREKMEQALADLPDVRIILFEPL